MLNEDKFQKLIEKIQDEKKSNKLDLSTEEDLSIAIMNLVSLEEHFFFTATKTEKPEYFDLMNEIREMRKELLGKMIEKTEGETWCISKHLLAASMRLIEVGTKNFSDGKKDEAKDYFKKANKLYSLFWAIRLKLINLDGVKKIEDGKINIHDDNPNDKAWEVEDILKKLVNCCDE
ncbi:MAG: hypothetical protein WDK96_03330 [Candidatus Paceibacterota bacterium]|jgi:hypothetical protein